MHDTKTTQGILIRDYHNLVFFLEEAITQSSSDQIIVMLIRQKTILGKVQIWHIFMTTYLKFEMDLIELGHHFNSQNCKSIALSEYFTSFCDEYRSFQLVYEDVLLDGALVLLSLLRGFSSNS